MGFIYSSIAPRFFVLKLPAIDVPSIAVLTKNPFPAISQNRPKTQFIYSMYYWGFFGDLRDSAQAWHSRLYLQAPPGAPLHYILCIGKLCSKYPVCVLDIIPIIWKLRGLGVPPGAGCLGDASKPRRMH